MQMGWYKERLLHHMQATISFEHFCVLLYLITSFGHVSFQFPQKLSNGFSVTDHFGLSVASARLRSSNHCSPRLRFNIWYAIDAFYNFIFLIIILYSACRLALPWRKLLSIRYWNSTGPHEARDKFLRYRRLSESIDAQQPQLPK